VVHEICSSLCFLSVHIYGWIRTSWTCLCAADGEHADVTGLQLPGVLDDMFAYTGPLGAVFSEEAVSLHLWAPTAQVWVLVIKPPRM
jgi:hypothetical protein